MPEWTQIRNLDFLEPDMRHIANRVLQKAKDRGVDIRVTETYRSPEDQKTAKESGAAKTDFGWHQTGMAVDFGVFSGNGKYVGDEKSYEVIGNILDELVYEEEGVNKESLIWGGNTEAYPGWGWDSGHIEYHPEYESMGQWQQKNPEGYAPMGGMLGSEAK